MNLRRSFLYVHLLLFSVLLVVPKIGATGVGQWSQKADMMGPRQFFSASAVNGVVYVIGGMLVRVMRTVEG